MVYGMMGESSSAETTTTAAVMENVAALQFGPEFEEIHSTSVPCRAVPCSYAPVPVTCGWWGIAIRQAFIPAPHTVTHRSSFSVVLVLVLLRLTSSKLPTNIMSYIHKHTYIRTHSCSSVECASGGDFTGIGGCRSASRRNTQ